MTSKLFRASPIAAAAAMIATIVSAGGSGAAAETPRFDAETAAKFNAGLDQALEAAPQLPTVTPVTVPQPVVQPLPAETDAAANSDDTTPVSIDADTLSELVAAHAEADTLTAEQNCLAGAIYFEAKSESLEGQLAV